MCRILRRLAILPIAEKIDPQERKIDPQNLCFTLTKLVLIVDIFTIFYFKLLRIETSLIWLKQQ